jgi:hypothetical protein
MPLSRAAAEPARANRRVEQGTQDPWLSLREFVPELRLIPPHLALARDHNSRRIRTNGRRGVFRVRFGIKIEPPRLCKRQSGSVKEPLGIERHHKRIVSAGGRLLPELAALPQQQYRMLQTYAIERHHHHRRGMRRRSRR